MSKPEEITFTSAATNPVQSPDTDSKILNLTKSLRMIDTACDTFQSLQRFQSSMDPTTQIIIRMNDLFTLMCVLKVAARYSIDDSYMDIKNKPDSLNIAVEKTNSKID